LISSVSISIFISLIHVNFAASFKLCGDFLNFSLQFRNCLQAICKSFYDKGNLFTLFVFDPGGSLTSTHCVCKILPKIFAFDPGGMVELIIKVFAQSIEDNCCKLCS
jgi:hypothetical protein